jgi:hypothetical protein
VTEVEEGDADELAHRLNGMVMEVRSLKLLCESLE